MRFSYPCDIVLDEEEKNVTGREAYVATFPDVYGATTGGWSREEALRNAEDVLVGALGAHFQLRGELPLPGPLRDGQASISLSPVVAAKVALYVTMRQQNVTNVELAKRLGVTEAAVRKALDPDHRSHISTIEKALRMLGYALVVELVEAPVTAPV